MESGKHLVLTVDDDIKLSKVVFEEVFGLDADHWEWKHFTTVNEAAGFLQEQYVQMAVMPSLVILDVQLQDQERGGIAILNQLRRYDKTVQIVMLSVSNAEDIICSSYAAGAGLFVSKPASKKEFRQVVTSIASIWSRVMLCKDASAVKRRFLKIRN